MMGLFSYVRGLYVGQKPEPVIRDAPYIDRDPRGLNEDDIEAFMTASERRAGMATWSQINFILDKLTKSDPVRVWRIRHDMKWVAKKAAQMGIEWDDLDAR